VLWIVEKYYRRTVACSGGEANGAKALGNQGKRAFEEWKLQTLNFIKMLSLDSTSYCKAILHESDGNLPEGHANVCQVTRERDESLPLLF